MRDRSLRIRTAAWLSIPFLFLTNSTSADGPAARVGDLTSHSGIIVTGSPNVRIGGQPAARLGDTATCPIPLHISGPISLGSTTVRINGIPAARVGDIIVENGAVSAVAVGAPTVLIGD